MSDKPNERSGADWRTTGQAPFDARPGPKAPPCGPEKPADAQGRKSGGRPQQVDNTDFGQPGGSRGGATPFGGVERMPPKTSRKEG